MSERIKITGNKTEKSIEIFSIKDRSKQNILLVWFILWTISGIIIFSQFFMPSSREVKLTYAVWMAFWVYFEYKASVLLTWRRKGKEVIKLVDDQIIITREVNGRGIDVKYEKEKIKNLRMVDFNDRKVQARVQPLYWSMGSETILFDYDNKPVALGLQLTQNEANDVLKQLRFLVK